MLSRCQCGVLVQMVGLAFELHDTAAAAAAACHHQQSLSNDDNDARHSLLLRIKYQRIDPSFTDILMYSFCYIGLLTGRCRLTCLISLASDFISDVSTRGGTGTRRLPGSGRVLHYPALPGPGRILL